MAPARWPLSEVLAGVLLLLLSPLLLPLLAIHGALWYRDLGANGAQRLFALKFNDQNILLGPSHLPRAMLAAVACFFRCTPDVYVLGAANPEPAPWWPLSRPTMPSKRLISPRRRTTSRAGAFSEAPGQMDLWGVG